MMSSVEQEADSSLRTLKGVWKRIKAITEAPTQFLLELPLEKQEIIKMLLLDTYQTCIQNDVYHKGVTDILRELVVEDMDEEQIWQQLELRNAFVLSKYIESTSKLLSLREEKLEIRLNVNDEDAIEEEEDSESGTEKEDEIPPNKSLMGNISDEHESEGEDVFRKKSKKRKFRASIVDDKFFKLREMEAFLEQEDAKEMNKKPKISIKEDDVDYFAEDLGVETEDDEDESNPTYNQFFDAGEESPGNEDYEEKEIGHRDHFADEEDSANEEDADSDKNGTEENYNSSKKTDDETGSGPHIGDSASSTDNDSDNDAAVENEKPKSSFELRQERLQQRIHDYEEEVLGEKPWQLKGEVQAANRPQNSLLEEILEFESTMPPPPVITEETTRCLEDIIKQRIRDQAWDDVEPKVRPVQMPHDYRKQLVLDQEKSKESLAQVYEKEYQRELNKLDPHRDEATTAEEEPKEHKEIRRLMRDLFVKLDALSNFHFVPKPVAPDVKIITNTPALEMEEVAPVAMSDAKLLAPEELYRGPKHELIGKTERNRTDKNRERRKKKQKQRAINIALEAKSKRNQELGKAPTKKEESAKLLKSLTKHRNVEKVKITNDDQRALKSSTSFFSKLQDTTSNFGKAAAISQSKKHKSTGKGSTAKKLKL